MHRHRRSGLTPFQLLIALATGVVSTSLPACRMDASELTEGRVQAPAPIDTTLDGMSGDAGESATPVGDGGRESEPRADDGGAGGEDVAAGGSSFAGAENAGSSAGNSAEAPDAAPPACTAHGPEVCNGVDDDCDGVTDEECPKSIAWQLDADRAMVGDSPGGSYFGDQCAPTEVMTGLQAASNEWINQIRGVCSTFAVQVDKTSSPWVYRVTLSSPRLLNAHPEVGPSTVIPLSCPDNQALVGFRIAQQHAIRGFTIYTVIPRLWISCAELDLSRGKDGYVVTWAKQLEIGPVNTSFANDMAWFEQDILPTSQAAVRLIGSSGTWLDRLGFGAAKFRVIAE